MTILDLRTSGACWVIRDGLGEWKETSMGEIMGYGIFGNVACVKVMKCKNVMDVNEVNEKE